MLVFESLSAIEHSTRSIAPEPRANSESKANTCPSSLVELSCARAAACTAEDPHEPAADILPDRAPTSIKTSKAMTAKAYMQLVLTQRNTSKRCTRPQGTNSETADAS